MGNTESNGKEFTKSGIMKKLFSNKEIRILMVGLDCAGKTTILYNLKMGKVVRTIPTIGFNVETVEFKNISFTVWDIGGQDKIRPLWRHYFYNVQGIIFVVDSNDRDRLDEAREELFSLLGEDELKECVVLILANKQDQPNCMKMDEMQQKLNIPTFLNRKWRLQPSCAITGQGLQEGLQWLSMQFRPHKSSHEIKKNKVKT